MPIPDSTRYARDAALALGAEFEDLDNGGGYLFRISLGGRSVLGGAGGVCAYPVNTATAYTISRDKAHTKAVLASMGLPVIPGGLFFAHGRRAGLRAPGREVVDAGAYAARLGYPVFCKPNLGSRGIFAEIVASEAALADYVARLAVEYESFLVEPIMSGDEHRVLVQDGKAVFVSAKAPPALVGDGRSTLDQLLRAMNEQLASEGVSPTPDAILGENAHRLLAPGERFVLPGRRNLSAAGGVEHVETDVPAPLARLACDAVAAIGLRLGAVDLMDLSGDLSDLVVIEVNGNPGLKTLELAGRMDLIRGIWTSVLNACLSN